MVSPSERRSSIAPEPWENLRYRSYTLGPLERTPPGEETRLWDSGLHLHAGGRQGLVTLPRVVYSTAISLRKKYT